MRDVVGRAARRMLYMLLKRVVRASMPRLAFGNFGVQERRGKKCHAFDCASNRLAGTKLSLHAKGKGQRASQSGARCSCV